MTHENLKTMRLAALFLVGFVLFNYPILSLFNLPAMVWGIPVLYLYLFAVWVLIIVLTLLNVHFRFKQYKPEEPSILPATGSETRTGTDLR
ncbi:MAG: hypothetical protein HKM93_22035 [Desulfobacteraceae bacterium]|nr:hypothetical protein [Desulfobacteraceae bacterium]